MSALLVAAGLLATGAITPGPNNLVVMRITAQAGFIAALPAIAGIVGGGLLMLMVVMAGAGAVFAAEPRLYTVITLVGGAYLFWLGAHIVMRSFATASANPGTSRPVPVSTGALFGLQFLNPKSWIMVLTVVAAVRDGPPPVVRLSLLALFTAVPALCLAAWCAVGALLGPHLGRASVRAWLDRVMGALLCVSALLLALGQDGATTAMQ
jgi:threonine/homoserine/homoserine lactone efflux protein